MNNPRYVYPGVIKQYVSDLRAAVRENRRFFLKFGKCDHTDFDETLHIQSTLRINNFPAIIDFLAKRLPW